jgi:hypothetical protein
MKTIIPTEFYTQKRSTAKFCSGLLAAELIEYGNKALIRLVKTAGDQCDHHQV